MRPVYVGACGATAIFQAPGTARGFASAARARVPGETVFHSLYRPQAATGHNTPGAWLLSVLAAIVRLEYGATMARNTPSGTPENA